MPLSNDEWYVLRTIVSEAAPPLRVPPLGDAPIHPAVDLVRQFIESGDESLLDRAAKIVAMAKPGIDLTVAELHPWLVIEKN